MRIKDIPQQDSEEIAAELQNIMAKMNAQPAPQEYGKDVVLVKNMDYEPRTVQQVTPLLPERVTSAEALVVADFINQMLMEKKFPDPEGVKKLSVLEHLVLCAEDTTTPRPSRIRVFTLYKEVNYQNYQLTFFKTAVPEGTMRAYDLRIQYIIATNKNTEGVLSMENIENGIPTTAVSDGAATNEEALMAARQLQKKLDAISKPDAPCFMEALIKNGEMQFPSAYSPTLRGWRGYARIEMKAEDLQQYGFVIPTGMKRIYQIEVTLLSDTVETDVMEVSKGRAENSIPLGTKETTTVLEAEAEAAAFKAGQDAGKVEEIQIGEPGENKTA